MQLCLCHIINLCEKKLIVLFLLKWINFIVIAIQALAQTVKDLISSMICKTKLDLKPPKLLKEEKQDGFQAEVRTK